MVTRPAGHRVSAPSFVGRGGELASLARALARPPAVAVVEGEAGIGKTRLVTELRSHPAMAGRRFVTGACRPIREPFPLGAVVEGVRGLAGDLAAARLPPAAGALRPLLPELAGRLPPLPGPLGDRASEHERVFQALTEVLAAAGAEVLVIEDAHWADQQTVDFLRYLLGAARPRLSVLLTFRGEEVDPGVRALVETAPAAVARTQLVLVPLDVAQTGALAAAILGTDRVSGEFATHLHDRASGLPFVIEELVALLRARGVLTRRGGAWVRKAIDELDVPAGVRDPVRERFARLPDGNTRAVVEAAAVLQVPVPVPVLLGACRPAGPQARRAVAAALESGLLARHPGGAVGFRHVLAAQAIYEGVPGPRRRDLHARAAAALAARDPVPLGQLAHHLRLAGRRQEWVAAAERAAEAAIALGHDDEAVRLLEDVLREVPLAAADRGRLAVILARAAHQLLDVDDGLVDLLSEALGPDEPPPPVRGELRLRMALLLERAGSDFQTARRLLAAAVPDLVDQPALAAHAMAGLGIPVPGVPLAEHQQWLARVLAALPAVDDPALRISLLGKVAMVQVAVGDRQWRQLADRILTDTGAAPRQPAEVSAFHSVGANACYAGHLGLADRLLTAAAAASGESRWRELSSRATLALLDYLQGRWDGLAQRAEALTDQLAGHAPGRADVDVVTGCLALARGDLDPTATRVPELAQQLADRGAFDVLPLIVSAVIRLALGRGEVADAAVQAHRFVAAVDSVPFLVSAAWALPDVTAALVAAGEHDRAGAVVARWERQLRGLDAPLAAATLPHARGTMAAAAGQLRTAADQYEALGCPYQAALAREQAGRALLRAGTAGTAGAAELRAALTTFHRLGAAWDLDRASGAARRYGVSVPARHRGGRRGYGADLSPREREVAELAADGRRKQEIADALYLSISTVRKHLAAAMRKLGVRSRAVLAYRLPRNQ